MKKSEKYISDFGACSYVPTPALSSMLWKMVLTLNRAVTLLNKQVKYYQRTAAFHVRSSIPNLEETEIAINAINDRFNVGLLSKVLPKRITINSHGMYFKIVGYKYPVYTASTDGYTIDVASSFVLSESFNSEDNHYGKNHPEVSHYAFLMLHEYGHILYRALERLPKVERNMAIMEYIGSAPSLVRCWARIERSSHHNVSEWFADVFVRACIRTLHKGTYEHPPSTTMSLKKAARKSSHHFKPHSL